MGAANCVDGGVLRKAPIICQSEFVGSVSGRSRTSSSASSCGSSNGCASLAGCTERVSPICLPTEFLNDASERLPRNERRHNSAIARSERRHDSQTSPKVGFRGSWRNQEDAEECNSEGLSEPDSPTSPKTPMMRGRKEFRCDTIGSTATSAHSPTFDGDQEKVHKHLVAAARAGDFKQIVIAVSQGAEVNDKNHRGQTPIMFAAAAVAGDPSASVTFLLDALSNIEVRDDNGWTPLLYACRSGSFEVVEKLLARGATIRATTSEGQTACMLTTIEGNDDLAVYLLDKKANLQKKDAHGWSLLFYAVKANHCDFVRELIRRKASLKDKANDGTTAFMLGACNNGTGIVRHLIKKLANVNLVNGNGNSALMLAIMEGRTEVANILIKEGAGLRITNTRGLTASDLCEKFQMGSVKQLIARKIQIAEDLEEENGQARREAEG